MGLFRRALGCLENAVHRSGEGLLDTFRVMVIDVPDNLFIETVSPEMLPPDWFDFRQYAICQQIGREWLESRRSAVLRVPSALIAHEWNYLLNPAHPDFPQITLAHTRTLCLPQTEGMF